jgi:preprotein translocase subunit SecA
VSVFSKVLRAGEGRKVRSLQTIVPLINGLEAEIEGLSDDELAGKTIEFRQRLENGEDLNDLLVESFAVVREAAKRTIGQRHFDVQLMGGMALHFGGIAEMKTGEGKTLVSTLPIYLNSLTGRGVHLITVNDYLARFHADWMGQIYRFLGISVGLVVPDIDSFEQKRAAYHSDVTYGTNTEMGFDYLRDNMAWSREQMVQRDYVYAIVDEVDSILVDEARTPLIISGPSDQSNKLYYQFASIARTLRQDEDYEVDLEKHIVVPTEEGIAKVERQLGVDNLYDAVSANLVHQLQKAIEAKELYHRDKEYLVADGEVKIVDEFTGRIMEGRRWSDGLHQAVEAKERVRIQDENHTWATVTLQNYFRMYEKLAGMTGTAETEAAEFASTYNLHVVPIPTNVPMIRNDEADLIYKTEDAKFGAVVDDLYERYETGQPVLVGTASVERSEHLSRLLEKKGVPHNVLNAKQHAREATIVAQAGRLHTVTVATNMAGRGVDILLGGNPEGLARDEIVARGLDLESDEGKAVHQELLAKFTEQCAAEGDEVRGLGGLYVLGSERHESRRIDNQLRGRAGRQGDPGESRFFLSLEDELMQLFATGAVNWVMERALPEDVPIETRMVTRAIERAQHTVEAKNAEVRKDLLKYDEVYNEQRKAVYGRRLQVIDGSDLRQFTEDLLTSAVGRIVQDCLPNEFSEEWDLGRLVVEVAKYYPTKFTAEDLEQAVSTQQITESLLTEAFEYYEERETAFPGGLETARQLERNIMLSIIDQRWRQHLVEMDYLREGIHLRGIAQTDPLNAWQREGYEMFEQLWAGIDDDYLQYVMHAQVVAEETGEDAESAGETPALEGAAYTAAADPLDAAPTTIVEGPGRAGAGAGAGAAAAAPTPMAAAAPAPEAQGQAARQGQRQPQGQQAAAPPGRAQGQASQARPQPQGQTSQRQPQRQPQGQPSAAGGNGAVAGVPDKQQKVGRNDPCWCGSGRKFKLCHGAV